MHVRIVLIGSTGNGRTGRVTAISGRYITGGFKNDYMGMASTIRQYLESGFR